MRTGPCCRRPDERSPGSRARSVRACQVLRPRRVARALAMAHADVLPSATQTASAPGTSFLSRLNGWPACTPADASPTPSRMPAHGLGPMWFAIPSSSGTCTPYSLPVSRRTCVKTLVEPRRRRGRPRRTRCIRFISGREGFRHPRKRAANAFLHSLGQLQPSMPEGIRGGSGWSQGGAAVARGCRRGDGIFIADVQGSATPASMKSGSNGRGLANRIDPLDPLQTVALL
jgi:hypothetical protein